jgi:hypothetical protein
MTKRFVLAVGVSLASCRSKGPAAPVVEHRGGGAVPGTISTQERPLGDPEQPLCEAEHLVLTAHLAGGASAEHEVEAHCSGPCSPEAQAQGEAELAELQAAVDRGDATDSELDYNFTECLSYGATVVREEAVGGRQVLLVEVASAGPHDVAQTSFMVAVVHCDQLFVSTSFGQTYANVWSSDELAVRLNGANLVVEGAGDGQPPRPLYQATLGPCGQPVVENAFDPEA